MNNCKPTLAPPCIEIIYKTFFGWIKPEVH